MPAEPYHRLRRLPVGRQDSRREWIIDPTPQHNSTCSIPESISAPARSQCLRKGCENRYQPRQRNQQFCNEPGCHAEVIRWQNAKRQQRWRRQPKNRERQARLARIRRQKEKLEPKVPSLVVLNTCSCLPTNAATATDASCPASSRCSKLPENFCDRPGCYEPTRASQRNHAKYCGNDCRNAVDRAKDRQRKSIARSSKYRFPVSNYGTPDGQRLSFPDHTRSDIHDRKTNSGSRPRPPPAN